MKKSLISLAVVAGMAASGAAFAEATLHGNVHLSFDDWDISGAAENGKTVSREPVMNNQTSTIGVKGSEDLGDGVKALYFIEFGINPDTTGSTISSRDQWVGIKGGMGTVKLGTMSNNYKQMGGKIDPMYRTALEGRGALGMQSKYHGGSGTDGGRSTDTVQFVSPKMGGMSAVFNTTVTSGGADEAVGVGFRYQGKGFMAYLDYLDPSALGTFTGVDEKITKLGGKFKAGPVKIGAQFEQTEDQVGSDYLFLSGNYGIDKNNAIALTVGQRSAAVNNMDSKAMALMYNHKMSKMTNVYAGYGDYSHDVSTYDNNVVTLGLRKKF